MKFNNKAKRISLIVAAMLVLASCTAKPAASEASSAAPASSAAASSASQATSTEKIELVAVIKNNDMACYPEYIAKVKEMLPQYEIIDKDSGGALNMEKTIKTMIASGNPCDLALYWPNQMQTFVSSNMAMDLTPYLEADGGAWKNRWIEGSLDIGTFGGKVYNVPYETIYPMIIANKQILDKAGVTLPAGTWSWKDFMEACKKIKENTDAFPVAVRSDWVSWFPRNALLNIWNDNAELEKFNKGEISILEPRVVTAFDEIKYMFDNNYAYPGDGAVMAQPEEIDSAFKAGRIAMKADVNAFAAATIKNTGITDVAILSFPTQGPLDNVLGGCSGYFIPANAKNPDASIELLKTLTSPEVQQIAVTNGSVTPIQGVTSSDPNMKYYAQDTERVYPTEIMALSPQINDMLNSKMPAEYLYNGMKALEDLENLRLEAIKK